MARLHSAIIAALLFGSHAIAADQPAFSLVINEDNSHFFGSRTASDMTLDGLHAFVDQYAGTKVSHLFLCPNSMRASYASDVWERIWDVGEQIVPQDIDFAVKWVDNARLLHERGLDPYAVWIARCREKGISPWLSMRMNDVHEVDNPKSYLVSRFWKEHPQYWRVPESDGRSWVDRAYNFGLPEVREYHLKLVSELLERYDPDGIELDWMRFGWHFKPGEEAEGAKALTAFMRDARALANEWSKKRGHPILVGARVPFDPDAALGLGMDGVTWAKEGLVDLLVPTPFWATADFDIPVEKWRERIGDADTHVAIVPGTEVLLRAYSGGEAVLNDLASLYGWSASMWHRGAEGMYTFNHMDPEPLLGGAGTYRALLERGLDVTTVTSAPRRHVATYHDTVPPGTSSGAQLPARLDASPTIAVHVGAVPTKGRAMVVLGWAEAEVPAGATVKVNGVACTPAELAIDRDTIGGEQSVSGFECAATALNNGLNTIQIQARPDQVTEHRIVWAELRIDSGAAE